MKKIPVGILGATGVVGQNYVKLLLDHPWFEIVDVAASERSAGKSYAEAVQGKWLMDVPIPQAISGKIVRNVKNYDTIPPEVKIFFSATEMDDKQATRDFEFAYASKGYPVVSNSSANRWTSDVPMIIPEINPEHLAIIPAQQQTRDLPATGFVTAKPNCSIQSYLVAIHALREAGFPVKEIQVNTLQALSGAGYRGLTSEEMRDNVVPYIGGEEDKTEREPSKILGSVSETWIIPDSSITMSAFCTRVPVVDGHTAIVHMNFVNEAPSVEIISEIFKDFVGAPQHLRLPTAPIPAIIVSQENDRPQVKKDVNNGGGMAITIGRIEEDKFFDVRFVALSHNTIRGAAGGAILTAELLVDQEYIKRD